MPTETLAAPIHRSIYGGEAFWSQKNRFTVLADNTDTNGEYGLVHGLIHRDGTPPPHVHEREDEVVFILRGEGKVLIGEEEHAGRPGDLVYLPRGIAHQPIATTDTVEVLVLVAPSDFIGYFREFTAPATHPGLPMDHELSEPPIEDLLRAGHKYGITFLPTGAAVASWPIPEIHAEPKYVPAGSGEMRHVAGGRSTSLLGEGDTQGLFSISVSEDFPDRDHRAPVHRGDPEAYYVLEGEYEVMVEWMTERVGPGSFIHVPRGIVRSCRSVGVNPGKMLHIHPGKGWFGRNDVR